MNTSLKAIINAKLIVGDEIVEDKILLFDKRIVKIEKKIDLDQIEIIDAKHHYVSDGFIDIHIHGSGGADIMDATPQALQTISKTLLQTGTTS
ncbi:MAG: N-acetylglucosamine-6-phosphate deacetylase, partial [Sulfurovum sp.]